jgi:L-threonylcarbamoyladenylate synthase
MILSRYRIGEAVRCLRRGGVIAYPTEGVWGLGCDPQNKQAVTKILKIKNRVAEKGVILIAGDINQLSPYLGVIPEPIFKKVEASWPGPITWVLPASAAAPEWITGGRDTVAVRVTTHSLVRMLCRSWGGAIVSTSANRSGREAASTQYAVQAALGNEVDYLLAGTTLGDGKPSAIRHWQGATLRERS